jgi:M3 family oligoendopeptidase
MKYSEMKYVRTDIDEVGRQLKKLNEFSDAGSFEEQDKILKKITEFRNEFESMYVISGINYDNDTTNKSYEVEYDYYDDYYPVYEEYLLEFYKLLTASKFKSELEKKYGKQLFAIASFKINTINSEIIEELKKENNLGSKYTKLIASALIDFNGKERNLQEMGPFMESKDRNERKKASNAYWDFFSKNSEKFDSIFDEVVKVRDVIAKKLGYKNFIKVGYQRMQRYGYDENNVADFRKNIKKYIVPLTVKLREKQKQRLGLDALKFYDNSILFKNGNATPKGSPEWIMNNGKKMYSELSKETKEFYDFMMENELMDVYTRKGKANSYCDFIPKYKSPYILANMNGTEEDINVLIHEAGHAFQRYSSRHFDLSEYHSASKEASEIHSMSMEFLTYPWMNLFFKEDTDKFKYSHLIDSVLFLPYGVSVDDFQHWIYENPDVSLLERKAKWRELEKIYLPYYDYEGNEFLEKGGGWQKQPHIYQDPFYYIDYCLAQICAFQFWSKAIQHGNDQFESTLKDYVKLCKAGGSMPFIELVKYANLESPFKESVIKKLTNEIESYIDSIDDKAF